MAGLKNLFSTLSQHYCSAMSFLMAVLFPELLSFVYTITVLNELCSSITVITLYTQWQLCCSVSPAARDQNYHLEKKKEEKINKLNLTLLGAVSGDCGRNFHKAQFKNFMGPSLLVHMVPWQKINRSLLNFLKGFVDQK